MEDRHSCKAKRTDTGKWVEGFYVRCRNHDYILPIFNDCEVSYGYDDRYDDFVEVDPSTICQCTGLKDKNGKLIWENDIVDFLGHKGRIVYSCGSFGIAYRECIDWEEIEANICPVTGCNNALYACENDNYISLREIYWNFNDEDYCLSTVEVIGSAINNPELLEVGE